MFANLFVSRKKLVVLWVGLLIVLAVVLIVVRPSNAMQQDLGRHLKLGEIIWETRSVSQTNLFSYTNPDFPFVNHHWLSEVVFYLVDDVFSLNGLFILKFVLVIGALFLMFYSAWKLAGFIPATVSFLIFLPLVLERTDERPELFGFFLFSLFFYLLFVYSKGGVVKKRLIFLIPLLTALWANFHISFVYGIFLVGVWAVWAVVKKRSDWRVVLVCMCATFFSTFLNPNGVKGVLYPLTIFSNYGYRIVENQNVFFLISRMANPIYFYFLAVSILLVSCILYFVFRERRVSTSHIILIVFWGLSFYAVRNFSFFGLTSIPVFAGFLKSITFGRFFQGLKSRFRFPGEELIFLQVGVIILILALVGIILKVPKFFGIPEYGKQGVDFLIKNQLPGNIFNNFDIGGYLDYRLYPRYKVFVDNRPEAYPKDFFGEYIKIQQEPDFREEAFQRYGINSVIFSQTDITPWAQEFLKQMVQDEEWEVKYSDGFIVIFVKQKTPPLEDPD